MPHLRGSHRVGGSLSMADGLNILWWSNYMLQPTGYGTVARNLLPLLQDQTKHEFTHLACSGLENTRPFVSNGVKTYGKSSQGGNLAANDVPHIAQIEDIDLILAHFDLWAIGNDFQNLTNLKQVPPIITYCPIDHDPPGQGWQPVWDGAAYNIPYVEFGERMMKKAGVPEKKILDPIYHGVDVTTYHPTDASPNDVLGVDDETFVVGFVKNNQGTRAAHERALHAFRRFLDMEDAEDDAILYMHTSIRGTNSPDIQTWVDRFGLSGNVVMPSQNEYRWGIGAGNLNLRYNAMDVLFNPVRGEGFGLPMLEAMSAGTPIVVGAFSSMPELVGLGEGEIEYEEGDDHVIEAHRGWAVPTWDKDMTLGKQSYRREYNIDHLAEALATAYNQPEARDKRGHNARTWAHKHTWASKAVEFESVFDWAEDELYHEDELWPDVEWQKVGEKGDEKGGVGAFRG